MDIPRSQLPRTYIFIVLTVLFSSGGNVLFSKGMKEIGEVSQWSAAVLAAVFLKVLASGWIWLGIGAQLLFLGSLLLVLSWADYSFVIPASAVGYAVVALLGHIFLGEAVSPARWVGIALICLGVALVGRTPTNTRGRS
jgi:drug/metabolite transporter (DMT)-like permease